MEPCRQNDNNKEDLPDEPRDYSPPEKSADENSLETSDSEAASESDESPVPEAPAVRCQGLIFGGLMVLSLLVSLTGILLANLGNSAGWPLGFLGAVWFVLFFWGFRQLCR
jgi:hypothetical protein